MIKMIMKPHKQTNKKALQKQQSPAKEDMTGKFSMPNNFYERVLTFEREIERQREETPEAILKGLMQIYSEAIEYFGYID